ncbi:MAG: polysaccharide deacetylase family protein [Opitutaceae bacterium]
MSLLVLMYHRARAGRHGNAPEMLDAQFAHIAHRYPNVLPGDKLKAGALNVCLTFDDGYFDFYGVVFPLLVKHKLRALLAIPPGFVGETTAAKKNDRLNMESEAAFADPSRSGFCTWSELKEMAGSGHVVIAAHGFTHRRLDSPDMDLATEIDFAQTVLSARVAQTVDSFVFPYGRFSSRALQCAKHRYRYTFRIGGAINHSWDERLLYRVDADAMESQRSLFLPTRMASYRARYWWNRLRRR